MEKWKNAGSVLRILGAAFHHKNGKDYQIVLVEYPARYEAKIFHNHQMVDSYEAPEADIDALLRYIMEDDRQFVEDLIAGAKTKIESGKY
ncbi:MAG: hypothetical protein LBB83_01845 [Treponema sp.]|jgi:hypothetical protein|nr:hypothetical protein [Treponema sp.]